ncbi:MAG TPA: PilZ domain-containing protein [Candidatus Sulfotelmatobacter sp.]|nr:PilZ domain-containing protein [Candidatus Sulfotelmatobacter sp.]
MQTVQPEPEMNPQEDHRLWERHAVVIPVSVTVFLNGERLNLRGEACDISRGGMRLFLTREFDAGTSVILEFLIPYNTMEFVVRGVVRNRVGFNHGLEFLHPTPLQEQLIERTCKVFKLLS